MTDSTKLSVGDILKLPHFKHAQVVAGHKGLGKAVSWVHVLEQTLIKDYVNGHEIILTTGAGWKKKNDPHLFINQLIEKNVTALCIQLGARYNRFDRVEDIPADLKALADSNNFPLIVFPEEHECRYVDLIHDLHIMIINQSYRHLLEQEQFLRDLYLILLNPHDTLDILNYLNRTLDVNVAYLSGGEKPLFAPRIPETLQSKVAELIAMMEKEQVTAKQASELSIACKTVSAGSQDLATLVIFSTKRSLNDYELLILDKCAISLAQEYYGSLLGNEKELYYQDKWIDEWLHGRLSKQEIKNHLQLSEPFIQPTGCAACLVSFPPPATPHRKEAELYYRISGIARSFLEQQDFNLHWFMEKQTLVLIIINKLEQSPWKIRLAGALNQIAEVLASSSFLNLDRNIFFSVGKIYGELDQLSDSYKNARDSLYIQRKFGKPALLFFDDLHIHRLIIALEKTGDLESLVRAYLQPLLKDGFKAEQALIDTLTALRDTQYNKIEAAKQLFISRQSIYLRIKTLEGLLGEDFITSPQKRICLETALYGLEYLNNESAFLSPN